MNDNFYNSRKMRPVNISPGDLAKGPTAARGLLPHHLVNLISPASQSAAAAASHPQTAALINMGFNASPFLHQNQLYPLPINPINSPQNYVTTQSINNSASSAHNHNHNHHHSINNCTASSANSINNNPPPPPAPRPPSGASNIRINSHSSGAVTAPVPPSSVNTAGTGNHVNGVVAAAVACLAKDKLFHKMPDGGGGIITTTGAGTGRGGGGGGGAVKAPASYPVRLLVNCELVGPLIGRKGEKIKEITASSGAKIDIKRESVPYSQWGGNNYMFSGCCAGNTGNNNTSGGAAFTNSAGIGGNNGDGLGGANGAGNRLTGGPSGAAGAVGESQIVFIVSDPDKCSAAIADILRLCCDEAREQGREEPTLGLLAEDRFCARLIGREGRFLNWVRAQSGSAVHVSNVPTITTLSEQPHVISLDRIISCRGGGITALLLAERLISDKIRQCVNEDHCAVSAAATAVNSLSSICAGSHGANKPPHSMSAAAALSSLSSFSPAAAAAAAAAAANVTGNMSHPRSAVNDIFNRFFHSPDEFFSPRHYSSSSVIGSGIVHRANPSWPDNLKLDENIYVRIPQVCAGSIIGSEGKSVRRIMAETGTYIQISKTNLGPIESVPAVHTYRKLSCFDNNNNNNNTNSVGGHGDQIGEDSNDSGGNDDGNSTSHRQQLHERLITIKGPAPNQCAALTHIFSRVRVCYNQSAVTNDANLLQSHNQQQVRLWVLLRVPKLMLGRLIGKDGKVIRHLQLSSRTFLSFPRLMKPRTNDQSGNKPSSDQTQQSEQDSTSNSNTTTGTKTETKTNQSSHSQETLHNPDSALFGDADLHPVEIFGNYESIEAALFMIRRLVYSSIFSQFGPALIPGPSSTGVHNQSNHPHPHHHNNSTSNHPHPHQMVHTGPLPTLSSLSSHHNQQHHQQHHQPLLMPPHPPPPPSVMLATGRRGPDCHNNVAPPPPAPFFNGIPHGLHPAFMQSAMRMPPIGRTFNRKSINYNNNNYTRSKADQRSQSDNKNKAELCELPDKKIIEENSIFKQETDMIGDNNNSSALDNSSECSTKSAGPGVLLKGHLQEPVGLYTPDKQFAQAAASAGTAIHDSRDDQSPVFNSTSPCSYYTDRCPSTPNYMNMSTTEDLSFITAQESFSNLNDSFSDQNSHPQSQQHTQSSINHQLSQSPSIIQTAPPPSTSPSPPQQPPLQEDPQSHSPQEQQQQQQCFSNWSNDSSNIPF